MRNAALTCQSSGLDRVRNDRRNVSSGEGRGYLQVRACGLRGCDFKLVSTGYESMFKECLQHSRVIVVVEVSGYPRAISVVVTVAYETERDVSVVPNG